VVQKFNVTNLFQSYNVFICIYGCQLINKAWPSVGVQSITTVTL